MPIYFQKKRNDTFHKIPNLEASSIKDFFKDPGKILSQIEKEEHFDLFMQLAQTKEPRGKGEEWIKKNFERQECLVWDIDGGTDYSRTQTYLEVLSKVLKIPAESFTVNQSGYGLHFFLFLQDEILDHKFFKKNKPLFTALADQIEKELKNRGLPGKVDRVIFEPNRLLRVPGTENHKKPDWPKAATTFQWGLEKHAFSFQEVLGLPATAKEETLSDDDVKLLRRNHDKKAVLSECEVIKRAIADPSLVKEPVGYGLLNLFGYLDPSLELALTHYPTWTNSTSLQSSDARSKTEHAMSTNPILCETLAARADWTKDACKSCRFSGKVRSPISIRGEDFIETEKDGFYKMYVKDGALQRGKPAYGDLLKAYIRDYKNPFYQEEIKSSWQFEKTHYQKRSDLYLRSYAERMMIPPPDTNTPRMEFFHKVTTNLLKEANQCKEFFTDSVRGKINLQNGVLDVVTREILPHSSNFGFKYCLPYAYDPKAKAPRFEQYLKEVTLNREGLQKALLDCLGAVLCPGYEPFSAGFWWLQGKGRNGKSKFLDLIKLLVGSTQQISLTPETLTESRFFTAELDGKLVCFFEEIGESTFPKKLLAFVKLLSSGGDLPTESKYGPPVILTNPAKLIFTANEAPVFEETTEAVKERIVVIPFGLNLADPKCTVPMDPGLMAKLKEELPGIFNMALDALTKLIDRGKVFRPKESEDAYHQMVLDSSSFERWFHNCCKIEEGASVPIAKAYEHYKQFMDDEKFPLQSTKFYKSLRNKLNIEEYFPVQTVRLNSISKSMRCAPNLRILDMPCVGEEGLYPDLST